ncbi:MAG: hypothetical protein Q7R49_02245 [Candidatus Daviesbacteria bacterium]|nr:hypothetical protein [Candidatus Daviesbacteria bacterium]
MLETLDQTNIGHLNLEELKTDSNSPFDFEKSINQNELGEIVEYTESLFLPTIPKDKKDGGVSLLKDLAVLFPNRVQNLLSQDGFNAVWLYLKDEVPTDRRIVRAMDNGRSVAYLTPLRNVAIRYAKSLAAVRTLYPDRLGEFGIDSYWPTLKSVLGKLLKPPIFVVDNYDAELSMMSRIAYPNRQVPEIKIQEGYTDEPLLFQFDYLKEQKRWQEFSEKAAYTKVLFPKRIEEMELDKDAWENMQSQLDGIKRDTRFSNTSWKDFVSMAANMKILAAQEVRFTDHGLELVMSQPSFILPTPALPEMRKF